MRILLFTEIFDCGGVDTFIVNLINNWPAGDDSFVIIANSNYPGLRIIEEEVTRPCEVIRHRVPIYSNVLSGGFFLRVIRRIISPVLRYLLICYNILAFRKLLLQTGSDALMVINGGYPAGDSCRAAAVSWGMFSGRPKSVHNIHSIVQKSPWYLFLQERLVDWLLCRHTSKFVTVSGAAAASMSSRPLIFGRNKTGYIYNGIEMKSIAFAPGKNIRDEIGISIRTPLCLMLGTYGPSKGHFFLFRAFKKVLEEVPDAHLLICGYGFPHEIKQVTGYVRDFQLQEHVHLIGFRKDVAHLLANSDILVVASQAYESFGFTSVEAMSHKVPVVATNVGGVPEVVADGEGGYCVDKHDVDSYARCIIRLLKDECLRKEQGKKGYARYRKYFTAERMSHQYADMLHEING